MALTNQERVGKALELLRAGLAPFIDRELVAKYGDKAHAEASRLVQTDRLQTGKPIGEWDAAALLRLMWEAWNTVFRNILGHAERNLVSELRGFRDRWAHQNPFSSDDADRALDSTARLLTAISAPQAEEVDKMKRELRRLVFDEQVRGEKRKAGGSLIEASANATLKPWREVITPHADVASGRYQQAEFAADLWQVHLGQGTDEYRKPVEFFRRTYLTESLKRLLVGGVERVSGKGGDPVIQLQTNFGGGKTHSMLALYHLFSGVAANELPGVDEVMAEAGVDTLPTARIVVLVGNKISPGNPTRKPDGTVVHTLWGELAWQLGGKRAYARIKNDDEKATSPGDVLRELLVEYGPSLILIDEWVAYARQLHDESDLPAGSFETQFTFAQALTESAKLAGNCLLVISLPASDTAGSPHTKADDVEVGGTRGREALDRLRNVVGRIESSWRPASAEEGFEIVRRRLFDALPGNAFKDRDVTARAFADLYRTQKQEFPTECAEVDYEKRIRVAYPIHPEIFDRLYTDWSTLVKFQRTRGVLRLMAAVIHSLWEKGDKNPLILPSTVPIDDPRVQFELTRYLSDNWTPIIEKDVDGPNSLPLKIDSTNSNLGKLHATRRVARTIYLGSAPTKEAAHRGIEDRRVKLGCVMPGEPPAAFGDALRHLAMSATYLYQDGPRSWYDTQETVTKTAEDLAEQFIREPDAVHKELEKRLRADLQKRGDFERVHPLPQSGAEVPDDVEARLVVLGPDHPHGKENSAALVAAQEILESRGSGPRLYRNTLVFLAADRTMMQNLDEALRRYLAWEKILAEKDDRNLAPNQVRQAETQLQSADAKVQAQVPETYRCLLVPTQASPQAPVTWETSNLRGTDGLAVRVSKRLKSDETMVAALGPAVLRKYLDDVPLWRGEYVAVKQLVEDFAQYLYLPRLAGPEVLVEAIRAGVGLLTWKQDSFAWAEEHDEDKGRYRGLVCGSNLTSLRSDSPTGLVVKPEIAYAQRRAATEHYGGGDEGAVQPPIPGGSENSPKPEPPPAPRESKPKRFHGSVEIDSMRPTRDVGKIAEEIIANLQGLVGAKVTVRLDIEAAIPDGASEQVVRTVSENAKALKFETFGFEEE